MDDGSQVREDARRELHGSRCFESLLRPYGPVFHQAPFRRISISSRIATAHSSLLRLPILRSPRGEMRTTSLSGPSNPTPGRDTSLKTKRFPPLLASFSRADDDALAGERAAGADELLTASEDRLRLAHTPRPVLALGELSLFGADQLDPALDQARCVLTGRRVLPHANVHR